MCLSAVQVLFLKALHTCLIELSALFLQNHQRPDFFGIFSFIQASSVAWEKPRKTVSEEQVSDS